MLYQDSYGWIKLNHGGKNKKRGSAPATSSIDDTQLWDISSEDANTSNIHRYLKKIVQLKKFLLLVPDRDYLRMCYHRQCMSHVGFL